MKRETGIQTRRAALSFRLKASLLQMRRGFADFAGGGGARRFRFADALAGEPVVGESKTVLWTESAPEEQFLLAGKIQNLRLAAGRLNGLEIPANAVFSFWRHVGRATRRRGYVAGRELREGCLIPNVGGGLCQLSNALYDAALKAGFEIVERHAHSQVVAGSLAEQGRDATVFWNYIDLRFKSNRAFRIEADLGKDYLRVRFRSAAGNGAFLQNAGSGSRIPDSENENQKTKSPNSCASCGVESCFRSVQPDASLNFGRAAFLVDEFAPEHDDYLQRTRRATDDFLLPLDGKKFKKPNYAWTTAGYAKTKQNFLLTFERAFKSRRLAAQGAARQRNLLSMAEKLAAAYAKLLRYDQTHLVVQQNLLPFLWKSGWLGGRTFDVLMNSLPMKNLQERLDFAAARHPESRTLGDFRADDSLVAAESEALRRAEKIVTAHTAVARLFGTRAVLLDWKIPPAKNLCKRESGKFTVVFPASTVGRKGCYELRAALKSLDVKLIVLGAQLEAADFWRGVDCETGGDDWLARADLVALPAFVEHKPRRLLQAVADRVPVVASKDCGLETVAGVTSVEVGDVERLRAEIERIGNL